MQTSDELQRLKALTALRILDTAPEAIFDHLTNVAARAFNAPIALISLVDADRQWFKACIGLDARETGRDVAFCDHAIRSGGAMVIPDATQDARFRDNPLVTGAPHIRFYAGAPLTLSTGERLGTLCIIDSNPRSNFSQQDRALLEAMAGSVTGALEMRRDISTFSALERERDSQKELLSQAEAMAGLGHWSLDAATRKTTWSPQIYRIHGVDPDLPLPDIEDALDAHQPEDRAVLEAMVERALTTGEPFEFQARIRRPDGEVREVLAKGACGYGPDGAVETVFGSLLDVTDLKLADQRTRRNEAQLRFLTEHTSDVIFRTSPEKGITWISPSCRRVLGYDPGELVGTTGAALIHPDDVPDVAALRAARFAGLPDPAGHTLQARLRRADGSWIWMQENPTVIRDAAGAPIEIINVMRDVTERHEVEAELARSEVGYRVLAENATDIIACYDIAGIFTFLSPAVTSVLGFAPHELIGRTPMDLMHPDDVRAVLSKVRGRAVLGPGAPAIRFEYRAYRKDGALVWLEANSRAIYDADGELSGFQDSVRDITVGKAAEAALAESELRYSVIAEHASDIITRADVSGQLLYASPSVAAITGYSVSELLSNSPNFVDCIHPDDIGPALADVRSLIAGDAVRKGRISYRFKCKDGAWIWLECSPTVVRDASGAPVEILDVLRDVSAQRNLEAELLAARDAAEAAAQVKTDFMANMSHEIRTPLTAILGFTSMLAAQPNLDAKAATCVARVAGAGKALLSIVNDVLDFSKLEAGQFEIRPRQASPTEVLTDTLLMFTPQAEEKDLSLELDLQDLPASLTLDPDRLRQILLNLISNAVKFTDAGSVKLRAHYVPAGSRLHIEVQDTGAGLTSDQQATLFKRFSQVDGSSTRQHGGTGLGLAICKGFAEAMGGQIGVRSAPGEGATFFFDISAPMADATVEVCDPVPADFAGLRILVVDDTAPNRDLMRSILESAGAEVFEAGNGPEALTIAGLQPVDLLILDIRMPDMSGVDVLRKIRAQAGPNCQVPAIAFTADDDLETLYPGHGFSGHARKPIVPRDLFETIESVVPTLESTLRQGMASAA